MFNLIEICLRQLPLSMHQCALDRVARPAATADSVTSGLVATELRHTLDGSTAIAPLCLFSLYRHSPYSHDIKRHIVPFRVVTR